MQSYCYTFARLAESLNIVTVLERRPCDYLMTQNWDSKNIVTLVLNWNTRWFILASTLAGVINECPCSYQTILTIKFTSTFYG